jgi:hypothetical protein
MAGWAVLLAIVGSILLISLPSKSCLSNAGGISPEDIHA